MAWEEDRSGGHLSSVSISQSNDFETSWVTNLGQKNHQLIKPSEKIRLVAPKGSVSMSVVSPKPQPDGLEEKPWVRWKVSRRLAHLRGGLHDLVKHYLGSTSELMPCEKSPARHAFWYGTYVSKTQAVVTCFLVVKLNSSEFIEIEIDAIYDGLTIEPFCTTWYHCWQLFVH